MPPESADARDAGDAGYDSLTVLDFLIPLADRLWLLILAPIASALLALGATYLVAPTYTAKTTFLPPQQQQSTAASALASLGALSGGSLGAFKSPADQYISLMQSEAASDRIIQAFDLKSVYEAKYLVDARRALDQHVRFTLGKKDGLITVEVDDKSPKRAADMTNRYVDELRRLTSGLAITEAQQRRAFFEGQLAQTRDRLTQAQQALQASGFNAGAIKTEPKAAAENYSRIRAEAAVAEVRLQTLRRAFSDGAPEVQLQLATLAALRAQLRNAEAVAETGGGADYIGRYREYKYQETLFELFARQYELARADESREGALVQVVDPAVPPEKKSRPRRGFTTIVVWALSFMGLATFLVLRHFFRESLRDPRLALKFQRLRSRGRAA